MDQANQRAAIAYSAHMRSMYPSYKHKEMLDEYQNPPERLRNAWLAAARAVEIEVVCDEDIVEFLVHSPFV